MVALTGVPNTGLSRLTKAVSAAGAELLCWGSLEGIGKAVKECSIFSLIDAPNWLETLLKSER